MRQAGSIAWTPASDAMDMCPGDALRARENSRATLVHLATGVTEKINAGTEFVIRDPTPEGRTFVDLVRGVFYFFSRQPRALSIRTPFLNGVVEGTELVVSVEADRATITVLEGRVLATNANGGVTITSGQSAVALEGQAPELRQIYVRPRDAVQWAVYYEPILRADSFERLEQVAEPDRDAAFYARRASLLLSVGQLAEARAALDQALKLDAGLGDAYALQTIIDVALNDPGRALDHGREAVARAPGSASARIALSYALQSNFELEAARDELLQAVQDEPDHALAWARLAEIWLSLGYSTRALEAAERATALSPDLARTQVVLGFVALARIDLSGAAMAFQQAITLDPEAPLARLGLGLSKIRRGNLEAGRRDIEIAVALSPDNALVRSYLGKAYFDERREPLPADEFNLAKALDPLDPTPWFYDAIRKQTLNRPVEALADLQQAIELNDNRSVYRSRLLLDQDLAARSAGLGRIYRDLGFEQLALAQGWNSVNAAPGDHSGHRFLADVYSALPRHEVARVSELLQAQLLQPLNINAVQPQLAETNLSILEGSGPAEPAFNEFNPLFTRNRISLLASGSAGQHGTLGDEVVVSGVWNKVSFSAGQFHFESDGFQTNNAQDRDVINFFVQASLTPSTSVQGEVRSTDNTRGDLSLRFDPEQLRPARSQVTGFDSGRLGFHHAFDPRSGVIGSFMYGRVSDALRDEPAEYGFPGNPGSLAIDVSLRGWSAEFQHLYRSQRVRVISGVGHFRADREETVDAAIRLPFPPFVIPIVERNDETIDHTNAYVYANIDVPARVTLTLGATGEFLDSLYLDADQINPKAGVTWQATRATTVRAAGFRTLHRSLIANQTIEPTQVAGFNQLFDGVEGEDAWRYGIGLDQTLSARLHAGTELSWRNLNHPSISVADGEVSVDDWRERFARAYLYSTVNDNLSLSVEYLFERFERDGSFGEDQIVELSTHRIPLGLAYFHPSGVIAKVKATIVSQDGIFGTIDLPEPGGDTFAVVDASVGFRLPRRYGLVTLEARNLFDQEFSFQDTDPKFPRVLPARLVVVRFTLNF